MKKVQTKGAAMERFGGNCSSMLSSSILTKFVKEFEKREMLFTPERSKQLRKITVESCNEIELFPSSLTADVCATRSILEQSAEATLPPLVFQFDDGCVMGMMINSRPEVVKNEKGFESTPAFAGFTADNNFIYGTEAETYCERREPEFGQFLRDFWWDFQLDRPVRTVDLNGFGVFKLPSLFYVASFIRKLKITAEESQCNGGLCQVAILAVHTRTTCAQRLRLKEAALLAGFKDAYAIPAEGLAAYYWFHKNETERKQNKYSKDFVIIVDLFGQAVVYKRSFEASTDGKKKLVVTPIVSLNKLMHHRFRDIQAEKEFLEMMRKTVKVHQKYVIPVLGPCYHLLWISRALRSLENNKVKSVDKDHYKYFAAKGAALLSENPETIGRHVRSMMETVKIEPGNYTITRHQFLPENFAQRTFYIEHDRTKYWIIQQTETVGYLVINGVHRGSKLKVTYELNWEGIWKVVGVSAKNPSDTDDGSYKAVSWKWLPRDNVDFAHLGSSSFEECKSLLLKILPSPNESKKTSTEVDSSGGLPPQILDEDVEVSDSVCSRGDGNGKGKGLAKKSRDNLPNDMSRCKDQDKLLKKTLPSTSQVIRRSARLSKVGATTSGLGSSQDQSVGLGSSTTDTGDGMQEKKWSRKGKVIRPNDIIVNTALKKIMLESDWVKPEVKIEQDSVNDFWDDGNGQQYNFVEHMIHIEESVVKIEVEEGEVNVS